VGDRLAVVIARRVYAADEQQALAAVTGWMAANDGAHRTPARYLGDGDVVEITVGGERLSNPVVAA
jgi:hypothetical protein